MVTILDRPMYSEAEAARLLRLHQGTLNYWLEGGTRSGSYYPPVIRVDPHGGHPPVTWAEFVEAGLLRTYRRDHRVPMRELRAFITHLREKLDVPYPLADQRPFVVENGELVREAQDQAGLHPDWRIMDHVDGRTSLLPQAAEFVRRVEWSADGFAAGWRPADDEQSPVRIDPQRRFGRPMVAGISTIVLWEQVEAGQDPEDVAEDFGVEIGNVHAAVEYERRRSA